MHDCSAYSDISWRTETIETANYSILNGGFRHKSVNDAPFIISLQAFSL